MTADKARAQLIMPLFSHAVGWVSAHWAALVRWAAHRWNRTCYLAGYGDGYDQGHFDGWAAVVMMGSEEDDDGVAWSPKERDALEYDVYDEQPF